MSIKLTSLAELRDNQAELHRFRGRVAIVQAVVLVCFLLLVVRLSYLQIVRHDDLQEQAENNRTAVIPTVPPRGTILDRNGVVLASNYSAYTLEITPSQVPDLEATIEELSKLVDIQGKDRRRFKRLREESKSFDSLPIRTRLTDEEVARFSAQRYRFPGVDIKARLFRQYPFGELASHATHLDHWHRRTIRKHNRHLQQSLYTITNSVGSGIGESLGAVASLKQKGVSGSSIGKTVSQLVNFTGEYQRWLLSQLGANLDYLFSIWPNRLL